MPNTQAEIDYSKGLEELRDQYNMQFRNHAEVLLRQIYDIDKLIAANPDAHLAVYGDDVGADLLVDAERVTASERVDTLFATGRITGTRQDLENQISGLS